MGSALCTDTAIHITSHNYARKPVHANDSDSDTDSGDSLFEKSSTTSSLDSPPPSPDNKKQRSPTPASPLKLVSIPSPSKPLLIILPHGPDYLPPLRIRTHLFKSTEGPAMSETPLAGSFSDFLSTPGTVWVDKLPFVCSLCAQVPVHNKLPLVRRPAGLGQSAFITTAMFAYEFAPTNFLHELFPATTCFLTPPPTTVVLDLDMGWAFEHNTRWGMETRINNYMNRQLQMVLYQLGDCLDLSSGDRESYFDYNALKTFQNIIFLLRGYPHVKLVILAEDVNWPLVHSSTESVVHAAFLIDRYVVRPIQDALQHNCIAGGVLLGRPVEDEPAWVHTEYKGDSLFAPIACDITHDECVLGAFGFSLSEISSLADELLEDLDVRLSFLNDIKASQPAYRHAEYIEYSMTDVLSRLRQKTGQRGPPPSDEALYRYRVQSGYDSDVDYDLDIDDLELCSGDAKDDIDMDEVEDHLIGADLFA